MFTCMVMLVNCDTTNDCYVADVIKRVEAALGGQLDEPALVHKVRLVAPDKHHVCITFRVPRAVAFDTTSPAHKRPRISNL